MNNRKIISIILMLPFVTFFGIIIFAYLYTMILAILGSLISYITLGSIIVILIFIAFCFGLVLYPTKDNTI